MKLDALGGEEIEAIIDKAIVDYEDVEMTDRKWEDKQLELVAKAQAKMTVKQIMEWGTETCPHWLDKRGKGLSLNHMSVSKRGCPKCWRELEEAIK